MSDNKEGARSVEQIIDNTKKIEQEIKKLSQRIGDADGKTSLFLEKQQYNKYNTMKNEYLLAKKSIEYELGTSKDPSTIKQLNEQLEFVNKKLEEYIVEDSGDLKMTPKGLQLLADMEVNTNSKYMVREDQKIKGIITHDVGDGGLTVGYGFYIKGGMSNTDEINRLKDEYEIIVKEGTVVDIDKILNLYQESIKKHEDRAKEYVKARGLSPNKHEFDALVIQAYNGTHYYVMDAFGDANLSDDQALEEALQTYCTFGNWELYKNGWTNRLRNIINLYRHGEYTKLY
jgi:hypothetical protein